MKLIKPSIIMAVMLSGTVSSFCDTTNKPPQWESSAAAGMTLTRGNSDTLLSTIELKSGKKWDRNEVSLGADGSYGKSKINGNESTTAEAVHGFGQYNRLLNERLYAFARLEGLSDGVANIDGRITFSPGMGYYLIKQTNTDLSVEAGPGFVYEKTSSDNKGYATLRLGEKYNYKFNERVRLWQTFEILPQVNEFANYIINAEIGIEADLTAKLSLRTFLRDSYDNRPAAGAKDNDFKWVTAIAYKF